MQVRASYSIYLHSFFFFFYSPFCSDFHFIIPFLFFSFLLFSCLPLIFFFSPLFSSFSLLFFCSGDLMLRFLMECQARRTFLSQLVQPVLLIIPTFQILRIPIQQIKWILVRECNRILCFYENGIFFGILQYFKFSRRLSLSFNFFWNYTILIILISN